MSEETAAITTLTSVPNETSGEIINTVHVESEVVSSQKSQKRKLFITIGSVFFICLLMGIAAIIYGLLGHDQVFKTKTNNDSSFEITPDMILPNTTLIVHDNTTTTISGDIIFYDTAISTNGINFNWKSFQNETYAFIQFIMDMEDNTLTDFELFNGFSGFEINVNDLHKPNSTEMAPDAALNILMFKLDVTSIPQTITLSTESESSSMTESEQTSFEDLFCGYIGEYFVELSIKLGSISFVGKDNVAVNSIHQYSRLLYSLVSKSDHENQWKWNEIDDAIILTNRISKNITSLVKTDMNDMNNNDMNEKNNMNEEEKRRLQTSSCSVTWYWLGDGYCDSSANNADCNWDNGDCCPNTCKTAVDWEDNDGNSYSGYSCGSAGYNCVPGCNVANPSWLGDGYCDKTGGYNTEECGYDLGDCCQDTCSDSTYLCGINGYDCQDSSPNYCSRSHCGNPCIGLCGTDCSCWTWTCGDCHCHGECAEHDTYCTCDWLLSFWCVNVFWINCDDGSLAVF